MGAQEGTRGHLCRYWTREIVHAGGMGAAHPTARDLGNSRTSNEFYEHFSYIIDHPDLSNEEWIQFAHPIWYDIRESDTLNVAEGRDKDDERHVCPLQLGTIERCIRLWSNPGELIFDPFTGIGSTGYEALRHNRKFIGIELKPSYFQAAHKNLERIIRKRTQATLFDEVGA
jgi:DNA modification methylase